MYMLYMKNKPSLDLLLSFYCWLRSVGLECKMNLKILDMKLVFLAVSVLLASAAKSPSNKRAGNL